MNELEQTIKGLQQNEEQAIKLLNENVQLKNNIKEAIDMLREMQKDNQYAGIGYELSYIENILKKDINIKGVNNENLEETK